MTYTETLRQGAAAVRRRTPLTATELLQRIHARTTDPDEQKEQWKEGIQKRAGLLDEVLEYAYTNYHSAMLRGMNGNRQTASRHRRTIKEIQESNARVEAYKIAATQIMIADFVMPNGKTVWDNKGSYLRKFSGGFAKIAAKVKPNQLCSQAFKSREQLQKLIGKGV